MRIDIKPLTVNQAYRGRRFKSKAYLEYEISVSSLLRPLRVPEGLIELNIRAGFSNKGADIDNIAKVFIDILQKKYDFNDNRIYKLIMEKEIVKKGEEFVEFEFKPYGLRSYEQIN